MAKVGDPAKGFDAWSFSRLKDWELCGLKAKLKHILKMREPGSEAMERGSQIHKLAELYSTEQLDELPNELWNFTRSFTELRERASSLNVEQEIALRRDWSITSWFESDAWLRVKMDCYYDYDNRRRVIDYKTGKVKPDDRDQLELYAVTCAVIAPETIEVFDTELWYLDAPELIKKTFTRAEASALKSKWEKRIKPFFADRKYVAKPNNLCRWCHFRKENGGPCKY